MEAKFILKAVDNATRVVDQVQGSVTKLDKQIKTSGQRISDRGKKNEKTFRNMRNTGAIALGGLGLLVGKARQEANALTESINAVQVVFDEGADKILKFGENSATSVGMAQSSFNQMATETGALLMKTGLSMDDVASETIKLTERAADLASVYNTDVDQAMSAINQALRGETEAIRKYAADVTDASVQSYMLANGIEGTVTEMSQQEKIMMRMQVLMADTNVVAGDFANTIDSDANAQRVFNAELQDGAASLGTSLIPVIKQARQALTNFLQPIYEWIANNQELTKRIVLVTGAVAGLAVVLGTLGLILPAIGTAITVLTGPIGLVIAAITALGVIVFRNWDNIKKYTLQAVDFIRQKIEEFIGPLREEWKSFWEENGEEIKKARVIIKKFIGLIKDGIVMQLKIVFSMVKMIRGTAWELAQGIAKSAFSNIITLVQGFVNFFKLTISFWRNVFTGNWKGAWEDVKSIVHNFVNTIMKMMSSFTENIVKAFSNIWENIKSSTRGAVNSIIGMINKIIGAINGLLEKVNMSISPLKELGDEAANTAVSVGGHVQVMTGQLDVGFQKLQAGTAKSKEGLKDISIETNNTAGAMDNFTKKTGGAGKTVEDYSSKVKTAFEELKGTANTALAEVTQEFEKQSSDLKQRADEILGSIRSLSQEYNRETKDDEKGLAQSFVEAKQKQANMEKELTEKKQALREEENQARKATLQQEISDLQMNIQQQKQVRQDNKELRIQLSQEIAEVERRNSMTKLEREIEDFTRRQEMRDVEYRDKVTSLVKELFAVKKQQKQVKEEHQKAQAQIQGYITRTTEKFNEAMSSQGSINKKTTDQMINNYNNVENSIQGVINSMRRLQEMQREASIGTIGFANGGVVEGGFRKFATGGVVSKPTMGLIGEGRYNEAVVPLPDGNKIPVEMKGGGGTTLNINLNGNFYGSDEEFADRIGDTIVEKFQQADQGNFARF